MPTAKGAATRGRIVDATVDALVRGGREAVHLDDILAATRTSKGQLFHYFPDGKRGLLRAATQRQVERLALESTAPLDTFAAWERWVDGIVRLHRRQTRADACEVAALAARVLDPDTQDRELLGSGFQAWHTHLADGVRAMRDAGVLRAEADPAAVASLVLTALQGGAVVDKATGTLDHLEPALRAALAHLHSLAAPVAATGGQQTGRAQAAEPRAAGEAADERGAR